MGNIKNLKLGGVYFNPKGQTIWVEFLCGDDVGYSHFKSGKNVGKADGNVPGLLEMMNREKFELDHVTLGC